MKIKNAIVSLSVLSLMLGLMRESRAGSQEEALKRDSGIDFSENYQAGSDSNAPTPVFSGTPGPRAGTRLAPAVKGSRRANDVVVNKVVPSGDAEKPSQGFRISPEFFKTVKGMGRLGAGIGAAAGIFAGSIFGINAGFAAAGSVGAVVIGGSAVVIGAGAGAAVGAMILGGAAYAVAVVVAAVDRTGDSRGGDRPAKQSFDAVSR